MRGQPTEEEGRRKDGKGKMQTGLNTENSGEKNRRGRVGR